MPTAARRACISFTLLPATVTWSIGKSAAERVAVRSRNTARGIMPRLYCASRRHSKRVRRCQHLAGFASGCNYADQARARLGARGDGHFGRQGRARGVHRDGGYGERGVALASVVMAFAFA